MANKETDRADRLAMIVGLAALSGGFPSGSFRVRGRGRYCGGCGRYVAKDFWPCQNYLCPDYLKKPAAVEGGAG